MMVYGLSCLSNYNPTIEGGQNLVVYLYSSWSNHHRTCVGAACQLFLPTQLTMVALCTWYRLTSISAGETKDHEQYALHRLCPPIYLFIHLFSSNLVGAWFMNHHIVAWEDLLTLYAMYGIRLVTQLWVSSLICTFLFKHHRKTEMVIWHMK